MAFLLRKSRPSTVSWSKERKFLEKLSERIQTDVNTEKWNKEELMLLLESIKTLE